MFFRVFLDFGNPNVIQPNEILIEGTGGATSYGTAEYGIDVYTVSGELNIDKSLVGSGVALAFQFFEGGDADAYRIDSFVIEYSTKGRR
jgi:hypothetical protein